MVFTSGRPLNNNNLVASPGDASNGEMHSLRISHESPGKSPGGETSNEQQFVFMTEISQRKEEMERQIELYKHQLEQQAQTIKDLKNTIRTCEQKMLQFGRNMTSMLDI